MNEVNISKSVFVTLDHEKLMTSIGGFAMAGKSNFCTTGVIIYIPTSDPDLLIKLLKMER